MHSARPTGWSGELPTSPASSPHAHGRHHRNPAGPASAAAMPLGRAEADPFVDTDPTGGLSKFDLGMVPASVTPPRSWRRAAWFAVASSAATLGGLMFATAALVGNTTSYQVIDLPNMPRGGEYPPLPSDPYVRTTPPEPPRGLHRGEPDRDRATSDEDGAFPRLPGPGGGPVGSVQRPGAAPPLVGGGPVPPGDTGSEGGLHEGEADGGSGSEDGSGRPGGGEPPPSTTTPPPPPPTTTPPPSSEPPALAALSLFPDTEAMRKRTTTYFDAVSAGDLRAAYGMTTGTLREEGFAAFASRYAGATAIEVVDTSVEWDSTVTTLRITRDDGTRLTQRRKLEFTAEDEPRIEADELVS